MSSAASAFNSIQQILQIVSGLAKFADEIKDFASFEEAKNKEIAALKSAKADVEQTRALKETTQNELVELQKQMVDMRSSIEGLKQTAHDVIARANDEADEIRKQGHVDSEKVKRDALDHVNSLRKSAEDLEHEVSELEHAVANQKTLLVVLKGDYDKTKSLHDRLLEGLKGLGIV